MYSNISKILTYEDFCTTFSKTSLKKLNKIYIFNYKIIYNFKEIRQKSNFKPL